VDTARERLRDAHLIRQKGSIGRKKNYQTATQVVAGEKNQRTDREDENARGFAGVMSRMSRMMPFTAV
jgi:hypothetical protein